MQTPPPALAALAPLSEALTQARSHAVTEGKRAFDAGDAQGARRHAERLDRVTEAETVMQHLAEILSRLDLPSPERDEDAVLLPPNSDGSGRRRGGPRLPEGPAHQPSAYYDAVLSELAKHSGAITLANLQNAMEPVVTPWLNESDHGWLPNHKKKRWRYVVQWSLTQLKEQGKVENPRRGYWKLRRG